MKIEHLSSAIAETARAYSGSGDVGQIVCEALRGVVARAARYEANDPDPNDEERIREIVKQEISNLLK